MRPALRLAIVLLSAFAVASIPGSTWAVDPPVTLTQLRNQFSVWDTNKDGRLDKQELAKAFRGPNAKPYEEEAAALAEKNRPDKKALTVASGRTVGLLLSPGGAGPLLLASNWMAKPPIKDDPKKGKPDYSAFPDYQFLTHLDKDGDGKISKAEFDNWARDYSTQSKKLHEVMTKIAKAEAKLNAVTKSADKKKIEADLRTDRELMDKITAEFKGYEQQLQKAISASSK